MNPTGQPFGFDAQPPNSDARAREEVNVPAILLLVVGGLLAAYSLYGVANNLLGSNQKMIDAFNDNPQLAQYSGLATTMSRFGVVFSLFFLGVSGFIIWAALQMRQLKMWTVSFIASILAMIPCFTSCCCLVGLPIGIYALVVLNKPEVKSAFTS
jgi:hypothetical protein